MIPGAGDSFPFGQGGSLTTVSEAQLTAGLVELGIYGIVSIYEKYDPAKDANAAKEGEAKPVDVKEPDAQKEKEKEKEKEEPKEKKDGMTDAAKEPKKRIRRRVV
jgi:hypothetical protein